MRVVASLLCALLVAAAFRLLAHDGTGGWTRLALVVGLTPALLYSTTTAAPNGLEMAAGILVWAAFLVLGRGQQAPRQESAVLAHLTVGGIVLATLRQLGPLWFLLTFATCLVLFGRRTYWAVLARHARMAVVCVGTITVAAVLNVLWVAGAASVPSTSESAKGDRVEAILTFSPLWVFQSIAAAPLRNDPAPIFVYVVYLVIGVVIAGAALVALRRRGRATLLLLTALTFLVPAAITFATYDGVAPGWQGRYALPYTVGFMLLCAPGLALLARTGARRALAAALVAALLLVQVACVVFAFEQQLDKPDMVAAPLWPAAPAWVIAPLLVVGMALLLVATLSAVRTELPAPDEVAV
jgi:hypothetical protein